MTLQILADFKTGLTVPAHQSRLPYLLYLARSVLSILKIALKMLSKIASQLAHPENESYLLAGANYFSHGAIS